ncbi:hypothetical protein BaRGS_00039357 [Batillaria attramentaria]|uniref:Uncharacterized protein n=1 Tax=Batillaria attramentaria TaxID=370345 RepID=A0ABD0J364_9CAEN
MLHFGSDVLDVVLCSCQPVQEPLKQGHRFYCGQAISDCRADLVNVVPFLGGYAFHVFTATNQKPSYWLNLSHTRNAALSLPYACALGTSGSG